MLEPWTLWYVKWWNGLLGWWKVTLIDEWISWGAWRTLWYVKAPAKKFFSVSGGHVIKWNLSFTNSNPFSKVKCLLEWVVSFFLKHKNEIHTSFLVIFFLWYPEGIDRVSQKRRRRIKQVCQCFTQGRIFHLIGIGLTWHHEYKHLQHKVSTYWGWWGWMGSL